MRVLVVSLGSSLVMALTILAGPSLAAAARPTSSGTTVTISLPGNAGAHAASHSVSTGGGWSHAKTDLTGTTIRVVNGNGQTILTLDPPCAAVVSKD